MSTQINAQKMTEQVFESYVWRTFESVCTGRPEFNVYFPEKEVDGETWPAVFETSVAVNDENGNPQWYRIRVYDDLAKLFNQHLKEGNKVARMNAQGYVKSRTYKDRNGVEQTVNFTVVPNKSDDYGYQFLKVLSTWQHMRDSSGGEDPFAASADRAQAETSQEDQRAEATAAAQGGDQMHGMYQQGSEEASPETFGLPAGPTEADAPF